MQTLAIIKQSALVAGLYLFQSAAADNTITIPSADTILTTASSQQPPMGVVLRTEAAPSKQPESTEATMTTTVNPETTLTATTPQDPPLTGTPSLPTATEPNQQQENSEQSIAYIDLNNDLLSEHIRATPSLASTQTLSELLSQLERVKEDLVRCQDDEMYAVIKNKEAEIKKRLESMNTEYLQYLALMQQAEPDDDTLLYITLGTVSVLMIGGAVVLTS